MIRTISLPGTTLRASCLGLGTASLGSRVSASQGRAAVAEALDLGVTWIDTSPVYGAGEAEDILAPVIAGRRDGLVVVTKVGLVPPARNSLIKLVYAAGRPFIGALKGVRKRFRATSATRNQRAPLTPESIAASLEASLRRLKTDRVEVFALHDPPVEEVTNEDVLRALDRAVESGKARYLAVSGTHEAAEAATASGLPFTILQVAEDLAASPVGALKARAGRPLGIVCHSIFGVAGSLEGVSARVAADPSARRRLADAGYDGPVETALTRLLLDRAFALNPDGVVLASMFGRGHARANAERAALAPNPAAADLVADLMR